MYAVDQQLSVSSKTPDFYIRVYYCRHVATIYCGISTFEKINIGGLSSTQVLNRKTTHLDKASETMEQKV